MGFTSHITKKAAAKIAAVAACLLLVFGATALTGCASSSDNNAPATSQSQSKASKSSSKSGSASQSQNNAKTDALSAISKDGFYYELEDVVLYLEKYGKLPPNFLTKNKAKSMGWEGGSLEVIKDEYAIGGDKFGNYERKLPSLSSGVYRECDIGTHNKRTRGEKRLIYVDDGNASNGSGPYYYTDNHYETFVEVFVEDGQVVM